MLADAGDNRGGRGARERLGGLAVFELDRERINLRRAIGIVDLEQPELARFLGHRDLLDDSHLANGARLRAKPATSTQVSRQDLALELGTVPIDEQCLQMRLRL